MLFGDERRVGARARSRSSRTSLLLGYSSRFPDLPVDEPGAKIFHLPRPWPTVRAGLHFFIPIVVLLWCLMVEEFSPGTSAFWATATTMALVIVQPAMLSCDAQRPTPSPTALRQGFATLWKGLVLGARNMIGIAVACASAGLIVGAITLTGMGLMMTDLVELVSAGNVLLMLILTAVICLLLGAGVPTTANYILVATLMAPVIVELGARSDLVIPLIAVHLFVFYFGIMADVTPPVGLASYAAAAISGEDPNRTGWQATWYSFRTALLPFVFIFNPQILFIGVATWIEVVMVCVSATVASLLFAAATMVWFRTRCTWFDVALLLRRDLPVLPPRLRDRPVLSEVRERAADRIYDVADDARSPTNGWSCRPPDNRSKATTSGRPSRSRWAKARTGARRSATRASRWPTLGSELDDRRREVRQPREQARRRARLQDRGAEAAQPRAPVAVLGVHPGRAGRRAGVVPAGPRRKRAAPAKA